MQLLQLPEQFTGVGGGHARVSGAGQATPPLAGATLMLNTCSKGADVEHGPQAPSQSTTGGGGGVGLQTTTSAGCGLNGPLVVTAKFTACVFVDGVKLSAVNGLGLAPQLALI